MCDIFQNNPAPCITFQNTFTQYSTFQNSAVLCSTFQNTSVSCSTFQNPSLPCSTLQNTSVTCSTFLDTLDKCKHSKTHRLRAALSGTQRFRDTHSNQNISIPSNTFQNSLTSCNRMCLSQSDMCVFMRCTTYCSMDFTTKVSYFLLRLLFCMLEREFYF